jgi:5-methylcytosine-specific restriction endonuclease McrA
MQWFRLYAEFATDPKVQMLSEVDQRRLLMLFCIRSNTQLVGLSDDEIAFSLRISLEDLSRTKSEFIRRGFIDDSWNVVNWDKRQFASDSSKERTRKYRDTREANGLSRGSRTLTDPFLYERDGHRCIYCQSQQKLCIDHITPVSLGGTDHYDNLGVACKGCNSGKSGRTPEQAHMKIVNPQALERYTRFVTVTSISTQICDGHSDALEQNRTEQNRSQSGKEGNEKESPKKPNGKESDWTDDDVGINVCKALRFSGIRHPQWVARACPYIRERMNFKTNQQVMDWLPGAWKRYEERTDLEYKYGFEKWLGEGHWADDQAQEPQPGRTGSGMPRLADVVREQREAEAIDQERKRKAATK